jgi:hypothetical protein
MIILPWVVEAILRQEPLKGATTMGMNNHKYIHNLASTVLGQIGGATYAGYPERDEYEPDEDDYLQKFWNQHGSKVMEVVGKMGASARGRILSCGLERTGYGGLAYHEVDEAFINRRQYSGNELLTRLASCVVVAAIVDNIRADVKHMRAEAQREDNEFSRGMAAYIHSAPGHTGATEPGYDDGLEVAWRKHQRT